MTVLAGLQGFFAYLMTSIVLLAAFLALYTLVTPVKEWTLIRQGNLAAAISLSGATLGFTVPLATAIVHSDGFADMVIWAAIALLVQLLCYAALHLLRRNVAAGLAAGDMAEATVLATLSIALGLLNAACMT